MERHKSGPERNQLSKPRLVYLAKLSFLIKGEIKAFHNKAKPKEFMTTKPALQKILKRLFYAEEETRVRQEDARKNNPFWPSRAINKK
jgi:hypothetical protein